MKTFLLWAGIATAFIGGGALLYGNTLPGDFIYDDEIFAYREELRRVDFLDDLWLEPYVHDNPGSGLYRPLSIFTFALNFLLTGENVVWFHAVNIVLHGIVSFLLFAILRTLFRKNDLAIVASILFLFLPIHSEAVASIKSRDELLAAMFALLTWLCFLRAQESWQWTKNGLLALSGCFYFFALLSKELIALVPGVFLLVWWWREQPRTKELISAAMPFVVAITFYLIMRFVTLGPSSFASDDVYFVINPMQSAGFLTQFSTGLSLFWFAVAKSVVPWNLSATYHYDQLPLLEHPFASLYSILGLIALIAAIAALTIRRVRASPLGTGIVLFLIPYALFSKLLFKHGDIFAERWLYFASAGVCVVLAVGVVELKNRAGHIATVFFVGVLGIYAAVLIPRNAVWLDRLSLGESMIQTAPRSIQGYANVGRHYLETGDLARAAPYLSKAIEIYPDHPPVLAMAGLLALQQGDAEQAKKLLNHAIAVRPEFDAVLVLVMVLAKEGQYLESLSTIQQYLAERTEDPRVRYLMAVNMYRMGQEEVALSMFSWDTSLSREDLIREIDAF